MKRDTSTLSLWGVGGKHAIAYRCLRKDRDERPTMSEIATELETALDLQEKRDANVVNRESYGADLLDTQSVLSPFKQYRLRVIAEVPLVDHSHLTYRCIRSIKFEKDDELFATAGSSNCIKIFDFANDPVMEISTSSEVSCLSWNKDAKNHLASSDKKGKVTIWDVNSQQVAMEYKEHAKRVWSVDFSSTEPSMLVSGGNDCKVKVWCTNQQTSSVNIAMPKLVCCVKYHPSSSVHIAVACQNCHTYYYDLRNTTAPLRIFKGHQKPVSHVKFLSSSELATASADNTLRLWDLNQNQNMLVRTFKGHTNIRNFVGFSVFNDFMACGSETNEVFAYHKTILKPLTRQQLHTTPDDEDVKSPFVSAVCWKSDSPVMIAGNSKGAVRVIVLET